MHTQVNNKWLSCKYDKVFKSIMLSNDYLFLEVIIKEILGIEEKIISNLSTEQKISNKKERVKIMDMLFKTANAYINIEVNTEVRSVITERNFKYVTSVYKEQIRSEKSTERKRVYQINLNYNSKGNVIKYEHFMQDSKNNKKYINNLQIVEINMDYLKKLWYAKDEKVNEYIHVLMLCLEKEELVELRKMRKGDEIIMAYEKAMNKMNEDLVINWDYDEDNEILIEGLKNDFLEEGIEKGMKKKEIEIVKNMLKINIPIDKIAQVTNLSKIVNVNIKMYKNGNLSMYKNGNELCTRYIRIFSI